MEQQFYSFLHTAKRQQFFYRQEVSSAIAEKSVTRVDSLTKGIQDIISNLTASRDYFKGVSRYEIDLFLTFYTVLLRRLNSS